MPRLITVCGVSYSGTTMLDLMLGNAPDAFSCGEVYAWFRPFRARHFVLKCSCGQQPCPKWQQIQAGPEHSFHRLIIERLKVNTVVDSSKNLCWVLDANRWASAQGIEVTNVLIWKDPADLSHSYWKRGADAGAGRANFVKYYGRFFETGLPFISLSFSELVQSPAEKLAKVCELIGIDYYPGKERFWENQSHHIFGSAGTRSQMERGDSQIQSQRDWPTEFWEALRKRGIDLESDAEVRAVLQRLEDREASRLSTADMPGPGSIPTSSPTWYHTEQLHRSMLRIYQRAVLRFAPNAVHREPTP